ncbi:MAG: hypothetical protein K2W95_12855 [Candidatus Obscuribacterales bacterium]|nr:hypothetical protein [Candidatus Obscuribacterales bacterium]
MKPDLTTSELLLKQASRPAGDTVIGTVLHNAAYSALQSPYDGVRQLADRLGGQENLLPKLDVIAPPVKEEFGSSHWHAQQIGGAIGTAAPFLVSLGAVKLCGKGASALLQGRFEQQLSASALKSATPVFEATAAGFLTDGIFKPVREDKDFWEQRRTNAITGGTTFGLLTASSLGLRQLDVRRMSAAPWRAHTFGQDLKRHMLSGAFAGAVNSQMHSMLSGEGPASLEKTLEGAYTFAVLSGTLRSTAEVANRHNGSRSLGDIVSNNKSLQAEISKSPEAMAAMSKYGYLRAKIVPSAAEIGRIGPEQSIGSAHSTDAEGRPMKNASELLRSITDPEAREVHDIDTYAEALAKVDRPAVGVLAFGGDSIVLELAGNLVLKVTSRQLTAEMGTRPFDLPITERGTVSVGGKTVTYFVQPKVEVAGVGHLHALNQILNAENYILTDPGKSQAGFYGADRALKLLDPFATEKARFKLPKFD